MKIGIYILAAGGSKRLGHPKQLLLYRNNTLLNHTILACKKSKAVNVKVILGAHHEKIKNTLPEDTNWILNGVWQSGMASSIQKAVQDGQNIYEGIILLVADQPAISDKVIELLLNTVRIHSDGIVSSRYKDGTGPPVYFSKKFFPELSELNGDQGAKILVNKYAKEVTYIPFPMGHIDIDNKNDLSALYEYYS